MVNFMMIFFGLGEMDIHEAPYIPIYGNTGANLGKPPLPPRFRQKILPLLALLLVLVGAINSSSVSEWS
jgi:hypothetical protein